MKAIKEVKIGEKFKYGGIEWVKLDNANGGALVLTVDKQSDSNFDKRDSNNWTTSSLRKSLNATKNGRFMKGFLKDIDKNDLIKFERDLTTDDGKTEYGTCKDFISLYTCDEYRKYRKFIPDCGACWHWTITADNLVYQRRVRVVYSDSTLGYSYVYISNCVRPLCVLKNETVVEVEE